MLRASHNYQGSDVEVTVPLQLNQGASHKWAVYHLWGSFFVTFLDKQKSKEKELLLVIQQNVQKILSAKEYINSWL